MTENSYILSLNDDLHFTFYAEKGMGEWLDKLADIMNLRPDNNGGHGHRVFCISMDSGNAPLKIQAESEKWATLYNYRTAKIRHNNGKKDYLIELDNRGSRELEYINMWYALYGVYSSVVGHGGFPLHAGLAEVNGKGVILAGRSGQGKSTSIKRISGVWPAFSDDETLIVHDKDKGYMAYPMPTWSGFISKGDERRWPLSRPVHVDALFFIEKADTDEITSLKNRAETVLMLNRSVREIYLRYLNNLEKQQRREEATAIFNNVCSMAWAIPCYRLRISLTGRFWEKIEEVVKA